MTIRKTLIDLSKNYNLKTNNLVSFKYENRLNLDIKDSKSLIYSKKIKKSTINTLHYVNSDNGKTRHFPPASQEWFNSIYAYNKNEVKSLPVLDNKLLKLLKAYLNARLSGNILRIKKRRRKNKRIIRRSLRRILVGKGDFKHTSSKVIITLFLYDLKKKFLTLNYWREYHSMFSKQKRQKQCFNTRWVPIKKRKKIIKVKKVTSTFLRKYTLKEYIGVNRIKFGKPWYTRNYTPKKFKIEEKYVRTLKDDLAKDIQRYISRSRSNLKKIRRIKSLALYNNYENLKQKRINIKIIKKLGPEILNMLRKEFNMKKLSSLNLLSILRKERDNINKTMLNYSRNYKNLDVYLNKSSIFSYKLCQIHHRKYLRSFYRAVLLYTFHISKSSYSSMLFKFLTGIVEKMYNKKVEFNLVNLKKFHLNSDIYTQLVAWKLRNRNNKLYRVLRSSFNKFKLPFVEVINKYPKENKDDFLVNKIRNTYIYSMLDLDSKKDSLNNLLNKFFPSIFLTENTENMEINKYIVKEHFVKWDHKIRNKYKGVTIYRRSNKYNKRRIKKGRPLANPTHSSYTSPRWGYILNKLVYSYPISIQNYILNRLKHLKLRGIRVEAKGRLTKRFTASRSVFKMRWKGGLKNIDSSFRGISTVMLRGKVESNVQYSFIKSKNRNGAFGVKGWISSR